jgi:hypothetical protein
MSTTLEKVVQEWLTRVATSETPPKDVIAYNIGLFKTEDGYSAYLVGSTEYDEDDADWACKEAFSPREISKKAICWCSVSPADLRPLCFMPRRALFAQGRNILADQHNYLAAQLPQHSRLVN